MVHFLQLEMDELKWFDIGCLKQNTTRERCNGQGFNIQPLDHRKLTPEFCVLRNCCTWDSDFRFSASGEDRCVTQWSSLKCCPETKLTQNICRQGACARCWSMVFYDCCTIVPFFNIFPHRIICEWLFAFTHEVVVFIWLFISSFRSIVLQVSNWYKARRREEANLYLTAYQPNKEIVLRIRIKHYK